ncbi:O-antigen ligase family protein [Maribacter sp. 2308TA10-17]|uniref:O-antigen ligase family protein n=1 Tax=Maribacter sp. 2308TA10-17 TaxID=3386276 RepID=UPI0039BC30E3
MLQYILALLTILTFGYFLFRKPTLETYVVFIAFALPFIDTKILPLAYGLVKVFDVITVVSLVFFFKDFISFRASQKGKIYLVLVVLFWVCLVLSKMNSAYPLNNLHFIYQPFTIFIFARFLLIYLEEEPEAFYKFISAFQLSVIVLAGIVFLQLLVGPFSYSADISGNIVNEDTGLIRYPGLFQDSQICGQFLAMGSFSLLYFKPDIELKKKRLYLLFFAFITIAIILAASRSALGGFGIGVILLLLFQNTRTKLIVGSLGIALGLLVFIIQPKEGVFSRTDSISEDYLFRKSIWEETGEIIDQYPLLGIGFGNFQKYIKIYKQDLYLEKSGGEFYYFNQPENGYLKILVEQGYLGFSIFLTLMVVPILKGILNAKVKKEIMYSIAAVLAWAVAFNTNYSLLDYRILLAVATFVCLTIFNNQPKTAV